MAQLITALRGRCRCVAVDHVGCGLSEKPNRLFTLDDRIDDLCAFVESLQLDRITLIAKMGRGNWLWVQCSVFGND